MAEPRICQLDGCEVDVTQRRAYKGGRPTKFCSQAHKKLAYRYRHPEELLARSRAYEAAHRQERVAYREAHRADAAAYRASRREENRLYSAWYRTTTQGVLSEIRSNAQRRGTR